MNIESPEAKLHPHVYKLREEFTINVKKIPDKFCQWYCLKEEKRLEYIKKRNLYPSWNTMYPVEPLKPYEEENNILRKLRQSEMEAEMKENKNRQREREREREREKEKEKNDRNDRNLLMFEIPPSFELKTARKSGTFPNNFIIRNGEQQQKSESINKMLQKPQNMVQTKIDFGEKNKKRKDEDKIFVINSPGLKKKMKK